MINGARSKMITRGAAGEASKLFALFLEKRPEHCDSINYALTEVDGDWRE